MFSNPLPDKDDYRVIISDFAKRYYFKRFAKDIKGLRWDVTQRSILEQLKRIHSIQDSMKVDELKHGSGCLLFKFDFAVAQSNISPKKSGNRCIVFLDIDTHQQTILMAYSKTDTPKNQKETQWYMKTVEKHFPEIWGRLT
jgi:hypothetical protein